MSIFACFFILNVCVTAVSWLKLIQGNKATNRRRGFAAHDETRKGALGGGSSSFLKNAGLCFVSFFVDAAAAMETRACAAQMFYCVHMVVLSNLLNTNPRGSVIIIFVLTWLVCISMSFAKI